MNTKDKSKKRMKGIIFVLIIFIVITLLLRLMYHLSWILSILISLISTIIFILLVKFKVIKMKSKEERDKEKEDRKKYKEELLLEEEKYKQMSFDELTKLVKKEEERLELLKEVGKNKKEFGDNGEWIWDFVKFGLVVFFVAILFFGSLDGKYFDKDIFNFKINESMYTIGNGLQIGFNYLLNSLGSLFITIYDVGSSRPIIFYWLWWITLAWWIGYMFVFKMLKSSWWTIRELVIPFIKKFTRILKGGQKKNVYR